MAKHNSVYIVLIVINNRNYNFKRIIENYDYDPDSNIVLAQIRPTSGPCEIYAGQMWAGSGPIQVVVW